MGIMDTIDIGAKALQVHGKRIDIHAKNIANLDTPNYVRKIPVLNAVDDISFHGLMNSMKEDVFGVGTLPYLQGGVNFSGVVEDPPKEAVALFAESQTLGFAPVANGYQTLPS